MCRIDPKGLTWRAGRCFFGDWNDESVKGTGTSTVYSGLVAVSSPFHVPCVWFRLRPYDVAGSGRSVHVHLCLGEALCEGM